MKYTVSFYALDKRLYRTKTYSSEPTNKQLMRLKDRYDNEYGGYLSMTKNW